MGKIILVQHCQSQHHIDPTKRFPDCGNGLTAFGQAQARAVGDWLAQWLAEEGVRLFSSDMTRAKETADIVGAALGQRPVLRAELREWSDPLALERKAFATSPAPSTSESLFDWRPFPGHESWREFHQRVSLVMTSLVQSEDDARTPVLVVHGGTLSNVVVWWLGIPLDVLPERTCFAASPGSLSVLNKNRYGRPVIERLNDRSHLAGLGEQN